MFLKNKNMKRIIKLKKININLIYQETNKSPQGQENKLFNRGYLKLLSSVLWAHMSWLKLKGPTDISESEDMTYRGSWEAAAREGTKKLRTQGRTQN